MFGPFERMVAMRYLRARRREGFISVIVGFSLTGIALGVATLIIVMSVMNGFRAELLSRILGLNGHLGVYALAGEPLRDFDALAGKLRELPNIRRVAPIVEGQVMATVRGNAAGAMVRGLRPEDLRSHPILADSVVSGSLEGFGEGSDVLIGTRFANRFGLAPGDRLTLVSPTVSATAFGSVPRTKTFQIKALFEIGMYEYDSSFAFVSLSDAQIFFRTGEEGVTNLEVMLADADRLSSARLAISQVAERPLRIVDWQQANASFFNAIKVERNVMFLILTLIILVAAFNIISGMIMMVKDKGRDIAILRTMGASRGAVLRIFLMAGASVGVVGTAAGFALGLAFSLNIETIRGWLQSLTGTELFSAEIYFLSQLPAKVDPMEVVSVVAMGLTLSFLATLYPAWRAARLDPVEALRYE
jgi:lipoprotein-releasing system permease protein